MISLKSLKALLRHTVRARLEKQEEEIKGRSHALPQAALPLPGSAS